MRISALFHRQRRCAFLWWLGWLLLWHHVIPGTSFEDEEDDESDGGGGGFGVGGGTTLEFTKSLYNASIYENAVVGRIYVTPTEKMGIFVKDPTVDIRYRIIEGDDDKMFKAEDHLVGDFCFLLIRIRMVGHDPPNREKTDEYRLRVQAWAKQRGRHRTREPSVTTLVMVKVLDTNDLRPLFHPIREYEATVPEDAPLHTTIVRVQAEDADVGINGEIYYSFLESTDQFAVQPTTGVVTLTRLLSYRNQGQFELTVVAQDRGTRSQGSEVAKVRPETAKLTISVREVNLHIPEFAVRHLPSIVEDGNVHIYAIVTVTDKDSGAQGEIASVVIADGDPNGHFRIYPGQSKNEYNIAVLKLVDRELSPNGYNLTLIATDKGIPSRHSSHRIPVRVTDFNDHPPVFDKAEYKVEIEEIAPVDTPLINVRATDADDGKNAEIVYRVEEGNEDATFTLDPHTGWLLLAKPLDAESRVTYILSVHAQDQGSNGMRKRGSCKIHIRVLDANDNDPVFTSDVADAWVKENEFISTVIHTVKAEDADYGENGYVSYSIANLNPTPFIVDHFSGEVKMKEVLDYERMRRNYTLKIRASDWGTPYRRQSETTVRVHLNDINDNRPQFERVDCTGYLSRGSPRNTEVITLSAIDFDAGSIVHYRIVSGNDDHCFAVNDTSGVVTLVCDLQHQPSTATASARERILNFTATDGEHFSDVMSVKITLVNTNPNQELANKYADFHCRKTDVAQRLTELMALVEKNNRPTNGDVLAQLPGRYGENKHAPEFIETMPSKIEVNESIAVGTKILDVKAIDRDLGFNGQVVYSISNGNVDGCFRIDMYNGSLFVVSSLDRERTSRYDLNISTWDLGRPQKMSFKSLIVDVGDYNDNPPIFLKSSFSLTLPENVRIGTTVVTFNATDRDVGLNARITYSLGTSTEDFVVDAVTGIMSVARSLDRERQGAYDLKVKAVDGSEELPLTATAAVLILVSDINDNVPRFAAERFTARVLEDLPVGTVVTTLSAYDPDLEEGGQVHYTLKNGGNDCFRVDRTTGTVRITRKLDFEERKMYNMTMEACDGDVTSLCSSAGLLVEVVDVNENFHSPKFDNFYANGSLRENEPIGTWVLKVTATDDDRTEMDSRIAYSIRDGDGLGRFSIDDQGRHVSFVSIVCYVSNDYLFDLRPLWVAEGSLEGAAD